LREPIDQASTPELRERMIAALRYIDPQAAEKIVGPADVRQ